MQTLKWTREDRYSVCVGPLDELVAGNREVFEGRRALLVTTPTVARLYSDRVRTLIARYARTVDLLVLDCCESSKTGASALEICRACMSAGLDRRAMVVALGGGVCSDLSTFAASMYRRGIETVRIPTTLIGQIDAGIGLKGGANFNGAKNVIGCFHSPRVVLADPSFLRTLESCHVSQGLAEILKIALIKDASLFRELETFGDDLLRSRFQAPSAIARSVIMKAIIGMLEELEKNPFELLSYKRIVDMGHTVSPVLEVSSGYQLHHGYAVAVDMAFTCALAVTLGIMSDGSARRFLDVIRSVNLPLTDDRLTRENVIKGFRAAEAHRGGDLNLPISREIGSCTFIENLSDIDVRVIDGALEWLHEAAAPPELAPLQEERVAAPLLAAV